MLGYIDALAKTERKTVVIRDEVYEDVEEGSLRPPFLYDEGLSAYKIMFDALLRDVDQPTLKA